MRRTRVLSAWVCALSDVAEAGAAPKAKVRSTTAMAMHPTPHTRSRRRPSCSLHHSFPCVVCGAFLQAKGKGKAKAGGGKARAAPKHPSFEDMIKEAIGTLKDRSGSSLFAIKKFIQANYSLDVEDARTKHHISRALKKMSEAKKLITVRKKLAHTCTAPNTRGEGGEVIGVWWDGGVWWAHLDVCVAWVCWGVLWGCLCADQGVVQVEHERGWRCQEGRTQETQGRR